MDATSTAAKGGKIAMDVAKKVGEKIKEMEEKFNQMIETMSGQSHMAQGSVATPTAQPQANQGNNSSNNKDKGIGM